MQSQKKIKHVEVGPETTLITSPCPTRKAIDPLHSQQLNKAQTHHLSPYSLCLTLLSYLVPKFQDHDDPSLSVSKWLEEGRAWASIANFALHFVNGGSVLKKNEEEETKNDEKEGSFDMASLMGLIEFAKAQYSRILRLSILRSLSNKIEELKQISHFFPSDHCVLLILPLHGLVFWLSPKKLQRNKTNQ